MATTEVILEASIFICPVPIASTGMHKVQQRQLKLKAVSAGKTGIDISILEIA